ncbi:MAG: hypothetical protein ABI859_04045 [Pseudomonadota bacterium]
MTHTDTQQPAVLGTFDDARRLAEWDFLRKTPEQRLTWLIDMLTIGYATGAFKPAEGTFQNPQPKPATE